MFSFLRTVVVLTAVLVLPLVAPSPPAVAAVQGEETLAHPVFDDGGGRPVLLRTGRYDGTRGYGWEKILRRHAITNKNLVQKLIQSSAGSPAGGESREYTGFAQRFSCDISGRCTEVERIPLRAIVDFRRDPALNGQKGVITAYCNHGPLECPSWVSNVANVAR